MRRRGAGIAFAAVAGLAFATPALADSRDPIRGCRVAATPANLEKLALAGFDVTEGRGGDGTVEVYGTRDQLEKFAAGEDVRMTRVAKGASAKRARARLAQSSPHTGGDAAWTVWTRFDRVPGDGKEQYLEQYGRLAKKSIVKQVKLGKTHLGRDIIALKVTRNAKHTRDNARPAVLYNALPHAREWLAGETCRRSLDYFVDGYGTDPASEPETKAMLKLFKLVDFGFEKNDHTAAELLLYPQGNQIFTRMPDHAIFTALAGSDGELSAIKDEETCPPTPARRSRSRSASSPTGARSTWACSSTTRRCGRGCHRK